MIPVAAAIAADKRASLARYAIRITLSLVLTVLIYHICSQVSDIIHGSRSRALLASRSALYDGIVSLRPLLDQKHLEITSLGE